LCPAQQGIHSEWDFSVRQWVLRFTRSDFSAARISQRREFCFRVERRSDFSAARISQRREFCFRVERAESLLGQAQLQAPLIPTPVSQQVWLFFLLLFLVRR
jgi:hypothetical protein